MYNVKWTGKYPCLCHGEWVIIRNGLDVSDLIPSDKRNAPMGTRKSYSIWHFEDWMEVFEDYEDGLPCEDWLRENKDWVKSLCDCDEEAKALYAAINAEDWRHMSCGGCI